MARPRCPGPSPQRHEGILVGTASSEGVLGLVVLVLAHRPPLRCCSDLVDLDLSSVSFSFVRVGTHVAIGHEAIPSGNASWAKR